MLHENQQQNPYASISGLSREARFQENLWSTTWLWPAADICPILKKSMAKDSPPTSSSHFQTFMTTLVYWIKKLTKGKNTKIPLLLIAGQHQLHSLPEQD